jgi:hypothetical protein
LKQGSTHRSLRKVARFDDRSNDVAVGPGEAVKEGRNRVVSDTQVELKEILENSQKNQRRRIRTYDDSKGYKVP